MAASNLVGVAAILILTGCPAPQKRPMGFTPLSGAPLIAETTPQNVPETFEPEATPLALEPAANPAELPSSSAAAPQAPALRLPAGMLPLPVWVQLCGFSEVRVTSSAYPQSLELSTPAGVLSLAVGQRYAQWNGVNVALGFPPVLQNGYVALNSLDIRKNIYPLASSSLHLSGPSRVLVIDPGHGGQNPGAKVHGRNLWEKDLALDWALRVEKLLENSSWNVVLTRRDDRDLSLPQRVGIADAHRADLFISLHFNSVEAESARREEGLETYCLTPAGMPSSIVREFEDDPAKTFPNNAFDAENLLLATRMHTSLLKATARRDRGVRRARFMTVLREQKRPAVLLEGGYISSPAESALILQPEFRQQLAQAVCDALPE